MAWIKPTAAPTAAIIEASSHAVMEEFCAAGVNGNLPASFSVTSVPCEVVDNLAA
jgi:hypothetical protein